MERVPRCWRREACPCARLAGRHSRRGEIIGPSNEAIPRDRPVNRSAFPDWQEEEEEDEEEEKEGSTFSPGKG